METEKINMWLTNILIDNITELNGLIYAAVKLVNDKINISLRNPNGTTKSWCKKSLEEQIKKLWEQEKVL